MSKLAVTLNLTASQRDTLSVALKGKKELNGFSRNNTVEVNKDNVLPIRAAVYDLYISKFKQKTKNAMTMETCFCCERIIAKIDDVLEAFGYEAPEEPDNDNEMGIVEVSIPSLTKVEEKPEETTGEVTASVPSLTKREDPVENGPTDGVVVESVPSLTEKEKAVKLLSEKGETTTAEEYREVINTAVEKGISRKKKK